MGSGKGALISSGKITQRIAIGWMVMVALLLSSSFSPASPIIVFGDSSSDVGNASATTGGLVPEPPYASGRFSNGPLWVEQLAHRLSAPALTPSSRGGTDYAYASATTGATPLGTQLGTPAGFSPFILPTGQFLGYVPSLPTQIASYIASLKGKMPAAGTLATVWAGANDFSDGQTNPAVPAKNIANAISTLIKAGVKNFLVPNLPDMSKSPVGLASSPATQAQLHALTFAFNGDLHTDLTSLASSHPGVQIHMLNASGLLQQMETYPARYKLSNVTGEGILSGNPAAPGYLFWDDVHPTTAAYQFLATAAVGALASPALAGPAHIAPAALAAPEPGSLTLLASGLLSLLGYRLRRGRDAVRSR